VRLLVTGADGYLGCLVAASLLEEGHEVIGVDTGLHRVGWLYDGLVVTPRTVTKDLRRIEVDDLRDVDAVVHLAELSNDPVGDLIGDVTYDINHLGSVRLARLAREAGVSRFVYMSSCSVYGVASGIVDETSPVDPQTAYARCKLLVERDVSALADDGFSPTFLRNATAFGASPRMRFDIVLNNLSGLAWTQRTIALTSDGTPWRPLVHALDIVKAIRLVLAAPRERVHGQVLNVGSSAGNLTVREIAETVAEEFPGCRLSFGQPSADNRSYRVAFDRIEEVLDFSCDWDVAQGAAQLHRLFAHIDLDPATFTGRGHTRLMQVQHLLRTRQVDDHLFWTTPVC
jgi:nucleoside-diphosphate-sugar epimerase